MKSAADDIAEFVAGRSLGDYLKQKMLRAAVEREFAIIGEALSGLRRRFPEVASMVPELERIIGFRNVLIHDYAGIDDAQVWQIIESSLPALRIKIEELLRDAPPADDTGGSP